MTTNDKRSTFAWSRQRGWAIATSIMGLFVIWSAGFAAGNLADALVSQPKSLGDDDTIGLILLAVVGLVLLAGGIVFALIPDRRAR